MSDQRRPTNDRKWDKRQFYPFIGKSNRILRHYLGVWKRCAGRVPHKLIEEQRRGRVEWCLHRLREFDGGRSERAWEIVSGNETFVYQYDFKTKQQSAVWLFPGGSPPVAFKRSRSTLKRIIAVFFAKSVYVASVPLQERKTVNTECYINTCLPKVSEAWSVRRPNAYQAPRAAASPRQRKCSHRHRHCGLPGSHWRSAGHPESIFPRLSPL